MAQKKISQLPQDSSPTTTDSIPTYDVETSLTKRALISDLITLFFNNIPTGAHSDVTRGSETFFDFVKAGTGVWSGDSLGVNKNASMSAMTIYINGRRILVNAVTARTFTASKDTYIDVLDNLDGTGTLVYTETTNNAASPALASNSVRVGIIVTGATTIAAAGSINQGQENIVLPIASSIAYTTTDSLGNLICPRDPTRRVLGYKQIVGNVTFTTITQVVGLSCPVIIPSNRKVIVKAAVAASSNPAISTVSYTLWDGTPGSGTQLGLYKELHAIAGNNLSPAVEGETTPAATSKTFNLGGAVDTNTETVNASSTQPAWIKVELG